MQFMSISNPVNYRNSIPNLPAVRTIVNRPRFIEVGCDVGGRFIRSYFVSSGDSLLLISVRRLISQWPCSVTARCEDAFARFLFIDADSRPS